MLPNGVGMKEKTSDTKLGRLTAGGSFRDPLEWVRIDAYTFEDPHFSSLDLGFRISRRLE